MKRLAAAIAGALVIAGCGPTVLDRTPNPAPTTLPSVCVITDASGRIVTVYSCPAP